MEYNELNLVQFIDMIIKHDTIDDILDTCEFQCQKGCVFERICDLIIKFNFCETFPSSKYKHMIGNANNAALNELKDLNRYLEDSCVSSGKSSGCSDITLYDNNNNQYIFISCKYPKLFEDIEKEKSIRYYDIQNIVAMAKLHEYIYTNYKIYLIVPDKNILIKKAAQADKASKYITKHIIKQNILDKADFEKYFQKFKNDIINHKNTLAKINYNKLYMPAKPSLFLRFHQRLIVSKTNDLIAQGQKLFLWGCKCRSGKTYMAGGIIIDQFHKNNKLNVIIITPAPTETIPQFVDELFNEFIDFDKFRVHCIEGSHSFDKMKLGKNNIFVMSKQLLQYHLDDLNIIKLKEININMVIFDENHFGGTTELSHDILDEYTTESTIKIFLTATYYKSLKEWNIPDACQMYWDLSDEHTCKKAYSDPTFIDILGAKHGKAYVNQTIEYYNKLGYHTNDIFKIYLGMPELHIITNMFDSDKYESIKQKLGTTSKCGFCFETLLAMNNLKTRFIFENEVKTILRYISGSNKEIDGEKTIFTRIFNICVKCDTRIPFTQIWYLPPDNINQISIGLRNLMMQDMVLKEYSILCINSKNDTLTRDIKRYIFLEEEKAKKMGKRGIIILAGSMLTLGITLRLCDLVILMNNTLSSDTVLQQIYRCMSEDNDKKYGFVVDLNISRVLNTCVEYTIHKENLNIEDKLKYLINYHLINIDVDMMQNNGIDSDRVINTLMNIWKKDPVNSFRILIRRLDDDCIGFDTCTQKKINEIFIKSLKDQPFNIKIAFKDDYDDLQPLPDGKEIIPEAPDKDKDKKKVVDDDSNSDDNSDDAKLIDISFTHDILPYIIPLTCILTIKDTNTDFVKMLNAISQNKSLLDIFDSQCLIWWKRSGLIKFITDIVDKYFNKKSNTYNISIQFKMSLQSLIDHPDKLLELVNDCLKPKNIEKKQYGEVFTPMSFIDTMLTDLSNHWSKLKNTLIWQDPSLKFYDPAAGMGNFPIAIYYKLFEGLKLAFPDDSERKKHIIENMLYFGELNEKNCFVLKQVFNINNKFKLNLYEGDTLKIDIKTQFNVDKFDVIIGNPPYNEEFKGLNGYAKPLFTEFIEHHIDTCDILSMVIPSRWFKGGKSMDKFKKMMLSNKHIAYIKHYPKSNQVFGNTVDIKGGVSYFLIDSTYIGACAFNGKNIILDRYDILMENEKSYSIIDKLMLHEPIVKLYCSKGHYGISLTNKDLHDTPGTNDIICYVSKMKGSTKYINRDKINPDKLGSFKVITVTASTEYGGFGNMFVGNKDTVHSESYISFNVQSEQEANNLLSYMKTKFVDYCLKLRKNTHNISSDTCKWIPLVPLDKQWTDNDIYKHFNLTATEIDEINGCVKIVKQTPVIAPVATPVIVPVATPVIVPVATPAPTKINRKLKSNRKSSNKKINMKIIVE